jgi:hypothetical protein
VVVPPVLITPSEDLKIIMNGNEKTNGTVSIKGLKRNFTGKMVAFSESDMKPLTNFSFSTQKVRVNSKGQSLSFDFNGNEIKKSSKCFIWGYDTLGNNLIKSDKHEIKYDHIPAINYFHEADVALKVVNVETLWKKDRVHCGCRVIRFLSIEQMGFEVNRLNQKEIAKNPLDKFDAIIVGVRAIIHWIGLRNYYDKL